MNKLIIRVCETALSSLAELQMENKVKYSNKTFDIIAKKDCSQATAINQEHYEFKRKNEMIEYRKKEVRELIEIAYITDFSKVGGQNV